MFTVISLTPNYTIAKSFVTAIAFVCDISTRAMRVGFWISDKKWKKLNVAHLERLLSERGHEVIRLDLEQSLEQQGPFGAIVHKVSDEIAKADQGDLSAQRRINAFQVISHVN